MVDVDNGSLLDHSDSPKIISIHARKLIRLIRFAVTQKVAGSWGRPGWGPCRRVRRAPSQNMGINCGNPSIGGSAGRCQQPVQSNRTLRFSADPTYGRAIGTVLRPSSSASVTLCIVAKRGFLEQKLLLRAYRKSYIRNRLVPK